MKLKSMWFCICIFLCALAACSPKEEQGPVDENAVADNDTAVADETLIDDTTVEADTAIPDEAVDTAIPDEAVDTATPDETADTATPDGDAVIAEGAYQQCDPAAQDACPEPMDCVKGYDNAQYGQCTKSCGVNEDCPPPPDPLTMQVACHTTQKVCLILCGAYESVCPAWLECFGNEMCLPPSSIVPTKGPGDVCAGKDECIGDPGMVDCIEGSSGIPHCYPLCDPNIPDDCAQKAPGFQATCTAAGNFSFCMFNCSLTVPCPGALECIANMICQG